MLIKTTPSFQSDHANVIFGSAPDPSREPYELKAVQQLQKELEHATSIQIFRLAPSIDAELVPRLSGRNLLSVAKLLEVRAPAAIENMPNLRERRDHLRKTIVMGRILSPVSLERMIGALRLDDQKKATA